MTTFGSSGHRIKSTLIWVSLTRLLILSIQSSIKIADHQSISLMPTHPVLCLDFTCLLTKPCKGSEPIILFHFREFAPVRTWSTETEPVQASPRIYNPFDYTPSQPHQPHKRCPMAQPFDRRMRSGSRGNTGAQRGHPSTIPFAPYSHPPSQERYTDARTTRSGTPVSGLTRPVFLATADPPTQPSPPILFINDLQVRHRFLDDYILPSTDGTSLLPPPRHEIPQLPYTPARTPGSFTPAESVSFSVNGAPGISVSQAIAGEYEGLDGRDDGISSFGGNKISCRIQVGTTAVRERIFLMPSTVHWV